MRQELYCAVEGEGRGQRAAGGARIELRAREWTVDATDHAGESCGGSGPAQRGAVTDMGWREARWLAENLCIMINLPHQSGRLTQR